MLNAACAGSYQRTKDGKTLVWNNHPDHGDEATWSGDRDERGYATGLGTLTWYRAAPKIITGSNIPAPKGPVHFLSRLTGTMAAGKFEGVVEMVNAGGRTYHTVFAGGNSNDDWEIGPAPAPARKTKSRAKAAAVAKAEPETSPGETAPAVKPKRTAVATATPTPEPEASSIGLFKPPSSLRETAAADGSPESSDHSGPSAVPSLTPAGPAPSAAEGESDEAAVRDLIRAFAAGWGNHDGHEMDKIMASEVDFKTADGVTLHGRAELEKYHARQPGEHFKDVETTSAEAKIRFSKPDQAQATWNWNIKGELNPDGTVRPRRSGVMTITAQKRNGTWLIVAAQNANAKSKLPEAPPDKKP
jgi:uncharacterized protein (TIGR02246 family)